MNTTTLSAIEEQISAAAPCIDPARCNGQCDRSLLERQLAELNKKAHHAA